MVLNERIEKLRFLIETNMWDVIFISQQWPHITIYDTLLVSHSNLLTADMIPVRTKNPIANWSISLHFT